ncbi:MAG: polysaccharide biosynthesis protein [Oscillochloridaceae bacterium umkhey_bin13]
MHRMRNRHLLFIDLLTIPLAIYLSFALRLDRFIFAEHLRGMLLMVGVAVVIIPLLLYLNQAYQHYWRYASIEELLSLTRTVTLGVVILGSIAFIANRNWPSMSIPRSIPLIALPLLLGAVSAPRLALRIGTLRKRPRPQRDERLPVLVMGAGDAGAMVVRELISQPQQRMRVVGLLDDNPRKQGTIIHGQPVLGSREDIPALVRKHRIRQVIIAIPTVPGKVIREILQICQQAGVQTTTMPGLSELIDGRLSVSQLRKIEITDLLRREPVQTDIAAVHGLVHRRRVLVTGGGGSIGSEICRQVLRCDPEELFILGHGENSIFEVMQSLRMNAGGKPLPPMRALIADIRDPVRIPTLLARHRPNLIFHAAAHKHVPLMESNLAEAISNNVLGTHNLLEAAVTSGVEHFVMISSDKAVNPTSVMGVTKRIAEMLVLQAAARTGRPFVAVRFGNVLGSRGSVVLSFKRQIAEGGPVTVTHPEMQRYFMTIPEAVQLVLQAAVLGKQGEIFMLEMGKPVKVVDLAHDMIRLSGLEEGRDIDIVYTGMRPGEKLFEELFAAGEHYQATSHAKIFVAAEASGCVPAKLNPALVRLANGVQHQDEADLLRVMQSLVPEYDPTGNYPAHNHTINGAAYGPLAHPIVTAD